MMDKKKRLKNVLLTLSICASIFLSLGSLASQANYKDLKVAEKRIEQLEKENAENKQNIKTLVGWNNTLDKNATENAVWLKNHLDLINDKFASLEK